MKKIVPLFMLLLLLCACAVDTVHQPIQVSAASSAEPPSQPSSANAESTISASLPSLKAPPKWNYDMKEDGFYRTDQNTGASIKIRHQTDAENIIITENWLYFFDDNDNFFYRMDNDNNREVLYNQSCFQPSLNGGWLYIVTDSGICRMKPDGSQFKQLLQAKCYGMVLTDKYIFYMVYTPVEENPGDDDGPPYPRKLHRADLNGENDENLGLLVNYLCVYENTVYYSDTNDYYLYSINPETLEKAAVYSGHFIEDPYFGDGYAFFITDRNLYRLSLSDGTTTRLTEKGWWHCLGIVNGYVYASTDSLDMGGLYRIKTDGVNLENIYRYVPFDTNAPWN